MFNLGMGEITVILLLALIFLGPKKLPELASGLGRIIKDIRKATADVKNQIQLDETIRKPFEELRDAVTLPPEELKRRDRLQKDLDDARRKAEQEIKTLAAKVSQETADQGQAPAAAQPSLFAQADSAAVAAVGGTLFPEPHPGVRANVAVPPPTPSRAMPAVGYSPAPGTIPAAAGRDRAMGRGLGGADRAARGPLSPSAPVPAPVTPPDRANVTQFLSEADLMPTSAPAAAPPPLPPRTTGKMPAAAAPPPPAAAADEKKS